MVSDVSQKNLFVSLEEVERVFRAISPAERKYRILLLLVLHGCRPCEAVALNVADFRDDSCRSFYVTNFKVGGRRDLKFVTSWVGKELKDYVEENYGLNILKGGFLFPTGKPHKYEHMSAGTFFAWFAEHRRRVGLNNDVVAWKPHYRLGRVPQYRVSIYSLRRLFATELAVRGVDQRVIAALMGHKDVKTTSQYQDRRRIFEAAPLLVERMPRLFGCGQTKLSAFA